MPLQELFKSIDQNILVDVDILDFSKAFYTVPHDKLLHKLSSMVLKATHWSGFRLF